MSLRQICFRVFYVGAFLVGLVQFAASEVTYEVSRVTKKDVLNIRSGPSARTKIIGSYWYSDSGIRIYRRQGNWALVGRANTDKPDGWVNSRYLKRTRAESRLQLPKQCIGTEPFWSLVINSSKDATYSTPDGPAQRFEVRGFVRTGANARMRLASRGEAIITAERCSDGMSDNIDPYRLKLTLPGGGNLEGCCR